MRSTWLLELGPNQTAAFVTPSILAEQFDRARRQQLGGIPGCQYLSFNLEKPKESPLTTSEQGQLKPSL